MARRAHRLPVEVRPSEVDLHIEVDPARSRSFRGRVQHRIELPGPRRTIELHATELRVTRARVLADGGAIRCRVEPHPEHETIVLRADRRIPAGPIAVECRFAGRLRDDLRGLYRAEADGHHYAISQLAATHARRVFPCFDEPAFKAAFQLSVTTGTEHQVIANEPVHREERHADGKRTVHFDRTPPLSSYLVAFAVGAFEGSRAVRAGRTPIRVWSVPGRTHLAPFALEAARESLLRLERYFGIPHPYRKCDLVAVPDFEFGAMENAGAVFFREAALLLDPRRASPAEKKRVAEIVCHELSHMWFGNLVTMAWWDDLWLNEAFATWMAFHIVDAWKPDWQMWREFQSGRLAAMQVDGLADTHPVYTEVLHPDEATENFDLITYQKGASIVRMLEHALGAATFRRGVRRYLRLHRQGNTIASDLWNALSTASGEDVEPIVRGWIETPGHPVIEAKRSRSGRTLRLRQSAFDAEARSAERDTRWPVLWVGRAGARRLRASFGTRTASVPLPERAPFVHANADEAGFFRPHHDDAELARLRDAWRRLRPVERIGLLDHEWALARAGRVPVARFLSLLPGLASEPDPQVLAKLSEPLAFLGDGLPPEDERREALQRALRALFAAPFAELGIRPRRGESDDERMRRAWLWRILGEHGADAEALATATRSCLALLDGRARVDPSLLDVVVPLAARSGNAELWERMLGALRGAATPQERRRTLLALADFPGAAEQRRTLRLARSREVASGDVALVLVRSLANPLGRELAWQEIRKHWPRLSARMGAMLVTRVIDATPLLGTRAARDEVAAFFRANPVPTGARALRQALQRFDLDARFRRRARPALDEWLEAQSTENA